MRRNNMGRPPADTIIPVKVRMREDLRRKIETLAKRDRRSVNGQTVRLLEAAVLAEESGLGGFEGLIKAARGNQGED
jgi:hypothetical protein